MKVHNHQDYKMVFPLLEYACEILEESDKSCTQAKKNQLHQNRFILVS